MRFKPQHLVASVCFALLFIQLTSCKKDNSTLTTSNKAVTASNAVADSTVDSSLSKGLIAWYTFNGDDFDHSGNHNSVVFNSAKPAKGKSGIPKTAYVFDGLSSYMEVANSATLNQPKISLYALVKPQGFYQGTCHGNRILSKGYNDYASGRLDLGFDDQAYYHYTGCDMPVKNRFENFYGSYGDGVNATGANDLAQYIQANQWYSLVYTYNGITSKFYVNGKLVSKINQPTTFNANFSNLFIGRNEDPGYPYYFNGIIDEIRIYKRVLDATEVSELYNSN